MVVNLYLQGLGGENDFRRRFDIAAGFVRVDMIAAGLIEDADEDGQPDRSGRSGRNDRPRGPKDAGGNR